MTLRLGGVRLRAPDGTTRDLSIAEFTSMDLQIRVRALLEQRVTFVDDEGAPVDTRVALRMLAHFD